MIYPTGAGEPRDISAPGFVSYDMRAQFLEDGHRVAYCGNAAGEASRCYLRDLAEDTARAVTPEGTRSGRASPDGTTVVARGVDGRYRIYPEDGASSELVPGVGDGDEALRFRPDGSLSPRLSTWGAARPGRSPRPRDGGAGDGLAAGTRRSGGLVSIETISLSADESAYAYDFKRNMGALFTIEGVR